MAKALHRQLVGLKDKFQGADLEAQGDTGTAIFPMRCDISQSPTGFAIGDSAAGYAALSVMPEGYEVLTTEMKIHLLAPSFHLEHRIQKEFLLAFIQLSSAFALNASSLKTMSPSRGRQLHAKNQQVNT